MEIKHTFVALVIALCVGFVSGVVFEKTQQTTLTGTATAQQDAKGSLADIQQKLGEHTIAVPDNAFVAQIIDINLVKQQQPELYKDARNGDYIIAFEDKVIVYDYGNDQVVTNTKI